MMVAPATIRVLCVDDHQLLAEGLLARLALERGMQCAGRLDRADQLIEEVQRTGAQIVLLDLEMPGQDPLERLPELLRRCPGVKVIILSAFVRDAKINTALERGVSGYFSKTDPPAAIFEGIRKVAAGGTAFGQEVEERLGTGNNGRAGARESKLSTLSPREIEVLRLIGRGMSRADIARELVRSLKTIDAHHTSIMRKLDIHDRAELTRYAIREGLVEA